MSDRISYKEWTRTGDHWVWITSGALAVSLVAVIGILGLIAFKGMSHFWPADLQTFEVQKDDGSSVQLIGELITEDGMRTQLNADGTSTKVPQLQVKVGNRDLLPADYVWVDKAKITQQTIEDNMVALERFEWGNFYGRFVTLVEKGQKTTLDKNQAWLRFNELLVQMNHLQEELLELQKNDIGSVNYQLERLRREQKKLEMNQEFDDEAKARLQAERKELDDEYSKLQDKMFALQAQAREMGSGIFVMSNGQQVEIPLEKILRAWQPNQMGVLDKSLFYLESFGNFLFDEPRENNTEGGVFPALVGTITMVFIMTILVTPMGVLAAVYLREYAKDGWLLRLIRISVNNLAGVPSIVFGIFGLGFFVYMMGGSIDNIFYPEVLPDPTFGTPGLMWASFTLALLTMPVVIVSTEEGLSRIPSALREGSLALGATKFESLVKIILPMASPAIMTGLILAIARAAGEVAPLMLVGVVKVAPQLPVDGNYPFIHLDQQFMHLGYHIYDVGFSAPNVEASIPVVFAASFLLVVVIVLLNLTAINIRNSLREKYKSLEH